MPLFTDDEPHNSGRELRLLAFAAVINAALFALVLSRLDLLYESNDDAIMMQIASGMMTGRPAEEIIFSNVLIGRALTHLYQWTPRVNWYTVYLIAVHVATMTALLYAFLRVRRGRAALLLFLLLFAQFETALLLRLQFTATAVMAGTVGLLLCATSRSSHAGKSSLALALGAALVVLGGAIRFDSLLFATLVISPFLVCQVWIGRDWRLAGQIAACLGLAVAVAGYSSWHYRVDREWRAFVEYNAARGNLHDLPIVEYDENTQFFFDRIGWNDTDWKMFGDWFFADPKTFSDQSLQGLLDRFQGGSWSRPVPMRYLREAMQPMAPFPLMMLANVLLALLIGRGRLRVLVVGLAECVLIGALLFTFACYAKIVPRVVLPGFFAATAAAALVALQVDAERRHLMRIPIASAPLRALTLAGALVFSAFYGWAGYQTAANHLDLSDRNRRDHDVFRRFMRLVSERYVAGNPHAVILNWWPKYPIQWCSPFDNLRDFRQLPLIDLNWTIGGPHFEALLRRYGIADPYRAAYQDKRVWICTAPAFMEDLARFVREHYGSIIRQEHKDVFLLDSPYHPINYHFTFYRVGVTGADAASERK